MRYLFTPEEVTVLDLLSLDGLPTIQQAAFEAILEQAARGDIETALQALQTGQEAAWEQRKRYIFALYGLHRAELLRRQCRWEMALQEIERVLPWLEVRGDTEARYDEAVALYLKGLLHYRLHTDDKARHSFLKAITYIRQCSEDWHYRLEETKLHAGYRLLHWIEKLLEAQQETPPLSQRALIPIYTPPDPTLSFDLLILPLEQGTGWVDGKPMQCTPLSEASRRLCCPLCELFYFAIRITQDGTPAVPKGRPGDIVVMSAGRPLRSDEAIALRRFHRYPNGQIVWDDESLASVKLSGIPMALCTPEERSTTLARQEA